MTAEDLAREIQAWQDEQWKLICPDDPSRSSVALAQHLTAAGWTKSHQVEAGMVVLNHWREGVLTLAKKYPQSDFAVAAHALSCVDAGLHGADDIGIPHNHPDWQKYLDAQSNNLTKQPPAHPQESKP